MIYEIAEIMVPILFLSGLLSCGMGRIGEAKAEYAKLQ
jgi:hypothetical protein